MSGLDQYEITHCACRECISYCEKSPGWFRPGEMPRLAESLKMPLKEVFKKYLIADFWIGESNIYILSPIKDFSRVKSGPEREILDVQREFNKLMGRDCDRAGSLGSWGYAFIHAPCIFLKDAKCSIYEARPFECAVAWHNMKESTSTIRELIAKEWKGNKLVHELFPGR